MSSVDDLIHARRKSISDPYRVVVKRADGSKETYDFKTLTGAQEMFFGAWRKIRSGEKPAGYSVALEENDGKAWRSLSRTQPNARQMRARHDHLAATIR